MKFLLPYIACAFILVSCQEEELNRSPLLREKFHGKYALISSYAKTPVDLNNDEVESTNLLNENSMIFFESEIVIQIPNDDDSNVKDNEFYLSEYWPTENEQRLSNTEVIPIYDTHTYVGGYNIGFNFLYGTFTDDFKSASVRKVLADDVGNTLIEIKSVDILENENIKVTAVRKLYTRNGWITTEIESVYKRYTIIT